MIITSILRMRPLISPSFSTFFPNLSQPKSSLPLLSFFPLFSLSSVFSLCKFIPPQNPKFFHVKPTTMSIMSSFNSIPDIAPHLHAGENPVVVGPMFAGRTTTLLRRESINSRFGPSLLSFFFLFLVVEISSICLHYIYLFISNVYVMV